MLESNPVSISVLFLLLLGALCSVAQEPAYRITLPNGLQIAAELPESNAKGLSGRKSLCGSCGMIFKFARQWYHGFWMKDTLIPLAIIWIDGQGEIVHVEGNAEPCPSGENPLVDCRVYRPSRPARYVLEVNPEAAAGLKEGMKIESSPPLD